MKLETFEDMEMWQDARSLVNSVYDITAEGNFARDYALRDQIRRASLSVMSNIAEGFDRAGNKEFVHFLNIAKASAAEVRSQLYIASDQGYIDSKTFTLLKDKLLSISRQLSAFMRYLKHHEAGVL